MGVFIGLAIVYFGLTYSIKWWGVTTTVPYLGVVALGGLALVFRVIADAAPKGQLDEVMERVQALEGQIEELEAKAENLEGQVEDRKIQIEALQERLDYVGVPTW
jgi:hypothetical protein